MVLKRTFKGTPFGRRVTRSRPKFSSRPRGVVALANPRTGGMMGVELKFHDATKAATTLPGSNSGGEMDPTTANCLNGIGQGDTESTRDGRKYIIKSIHVQGTIVRPVAANNTAYPGQALGWIALVWDKQSNGAQLNSEDVYTGTETEFPFRNLQFESRFKVLRFMKYNFSSPEASFDGTNIESGAQSKPFEWNVRMSTPVTTTGTGATISSISDNSYHVIGGANSASAPLNGQISYNSRVRFVG